MSMAVHFTSTTDLWATPQKVFDALNDEFGFNLDVCANAANAKCKTFFTQDDNGLEKDWGQTVAWMNPPYGRTIGAWMKKAVDAWNKGATVVCLVPARTDTSWWHNFAMLGEIRYIRGRLNFGDGKGRAPFPSAVVVFRGPF